MAGSVAEDLAGKLEDLGLPVPDELSASAAADALLAAAPVGALLTTLATQLAAGYAALGMDAPAVPPAWDAAALAAFASAAGCSYAAAAAPLVAADYLASELQCVRSALAARRAAIVPTASPQPVSLASELHLLCRLLSIPSFSDEALHHAPEKPLAAIHAKLGSLLGRLPADALAEQVPLLDAAAATPEVLAVLATINEHLRGDYGLRRSMLLQRLDVTVQSFLWSARASGKEKDIMAAVRSRRGALSANPAHITPGDAFTAGADLSRALTARITDDATRALRSASVKGVLIGKVPDRGGRVSLSDKPSARELGMPAWQARKEEKKAQGQQGQQGGGGGKGGQQQGGKGAGSSPSAAAAAAPAAVGTGGEVAYDASHYDRAKELLREAAGREGEAGAAVEELEREEAAGGDDGDAVMDTGASAVGAASSSPSGGGGGGGGRGGYRGGRGRGGRR